MENPEQIIINYTCKDFYCKYSPGAVGVAMPISLEDFKTENYTAPKCPKCKGEMISNTNHEIRDMLWDAGISW